MAKIDSRGYFVIGKLIWKEERKCQGKWRVITGNSQYGKRHHRCLPATGMTSMTIIPI